MSSLKIAFLWHQHQPYYKRYEEFILPWVRLHGVKDYFDLPALLREYPNIKQTFNLVPSLLQQIDEYLSGTTQDTAQRLTKFKAVELNLEQKSDILDQFFVCHLDNMILKYPRFRELYEQRKSVGSNIEAVDDSYWLDLQCWYNLSWIGEISKQDNRIAELFEKQRKFSENDKAYILECHNRILSNIAMIYRELQKSSQIEISLSPYYHPILPLLCDTDIAKVSQAELKFNNGILSRPEDAECQVVEAKNFFRDKFGHDATGMWPSEGSVSEETLDIMIRNGIKWTATDEGILQKSKHDLKSTDKYFPYKYENDSGELVMFFRDHNLSDKIGFNYSSWNPIDAVNDFMFNLYSIKNDLIEELGNESLDKAIVPIILDGENCWEFYKDNGIHFLRELYRRMSETDDFETVTFSEYVADTKNIQTLDHIFPGSWINSNFDIWIGQDEHDKAWHLLADARNTIEIKKTMLSEEVLKKAMEHIYIAEGSDWFWWYSDKHQAPNKRDFDVLFRWNLRKVYEICEELIPKELFQNIGNDNAKPKLEYPKSKSEIDFSNTAGWGVYRTKSEFSTMHQVNDLVEDIYFASDDDYLYIKFKKTSDAQIDKIALVTPETQMECDLKLEYGFYTASAKLDKIKANKLIQFKVKIIFSDREFLHPKDEYIGFRV